ncbi:hypothetical protein [Streptomyces sp. NPDC126514]|uniref:hypothetical protein n=1 Tax=Streptomyces sp. NPDC126514 TaxID=3155210 RepID=UPI00332C285D
MSDLASALACRYLKRLPVAGAESASRVSSSVLGARLLMLKTTTSGKGGRLAFTPHHSWGHREVLLAALLALLLTALTIGGIVSVSRHGGPVETVLVEAAFVAALAAGAWMSWKRTGPGRRTITNAQPSERPWGQR